MQYVAAFSLYQGWKMSYSITVPEWDGLPEREKEGLIFHWEKEIRNFKIAIENRIDEFKERGDFDE